MLYSTVAHVATLAAHTAKPHVATSALAAQSHVATSGLAAKSHVATLTALAAELCPAAAVMGLLEKVDERHPVHCPSFAAAVLDPAAKNSCVPCNIQQSYLTTEKKLINKIHISKNQVNLAKVVQRALLGEEGSVAHLAEATRWSTGGLQNAVEGSACSGQSRLQLQKKQRRLAWSQLQ